MVKTIRCFKNIRRFNCHSGIRILISLWLVEIEKEDMSLLVLSIFGRFDELINKPINVIFSTANRSSLFNQGINN